MMGSHLIVQIGDLYIENCWLDLSDREKVIQLTNQISKAKSFSSYEDVNELIKFCKDSRITMARIIKVTVNFIEVE